jgi:hypothetical protein
MSDDTLTAENVLIPILEKGLGERTFADFEKATKGEMDLHTGLTFRRTRFKMRVGLHLNRPTQAIIAEGQFVRMRAAPEYADYELRVLDAQKPDSCLYEQLVAVVGKHTDRRWRPINWVQKTSMAAWRLMIRGKATDDAQTS